VTDHYDRQGQPIDLWGWADLMEDPEYRRVAETVLFDGTWISTVWLGLDHSFGDEPPPLIFETMVFSKKAHVSADKARANPEASAHMRGQEIWRYPTEAAALSGHDQVVAKIAEALERLRDAVAELEVNNDR
jgi:hypothetical protein